MNTEMEREREREREEGIEIPIVQLCLHTLLLFSSTNDYKFLAELRNN